MGHYFLDTQYKDNGQPFCDIKSGGPACREEGRGVNIMDLLSLEISGAQW